jgi:hypothetical protein
MENHYLFQDKLNCLIPYKLIDIMEDGQINLLEQHCHCSRLFGHILSENLLELLEQLYLGTYL